jgi:hypothetical protein
MKFEGHSTDRIGRLLRSLPARVSPPGLTTRLRVLASRELQRRRQTAWDRWMAWFDRVGMIAGNMVRPLALPFAGGLFSAVALFTTFLVPNYPLRPDSGSDVPTMLTTAAFIKNTAPIGAAGGDVVVDVSIDEQGRMVDYIVISGAAILTDLAFRRRLENTLMFTEFVPATSFGVPTSSRIRLSLNSSSVEVKG